MLCFPSASGQSNEQDEDVLLVNYWGDMCGYTIVELFNTLTITRCWYFVHIAKIFADRKIAGYVTAFFAPSPDHQAGEVIAPKALLQDAGTRRKLHSALAVKMEYFHQLWACHG